MEEAETIRRLEAAMASIPARTSEVFLAHRLEALGYGEIARRTGLTVAEIERHMTKAISEVDRFLDQPSADEPLGLPSIMTRARRYFLWGAARFGRLS